MADGIKAEAAALLGRGIAQRQRAPAMRHLVQHDGDDQAGDDQRGNEKGLGH